MSLTLGIDIGTTTIKASLIDQRKVIEAHSEQSNVSVETDTDKKDEQDVVKILKTVNAIIAKFPLELRQKITRIGITGQMHGITLWNHTLRLNDLLQSQSNPDVSSLITWRDRRCSDKFLSTLPHPPHPVSTGYGCCTLFWLNRFAPDIVKRFDRAGTIMDLVVFLLCQLDTVVMSNHNANSWGYFNIARNHWKTDILSSGGFPVGLLPRVVHAPCLAGHLAQSWEEIPSGTPVGVAMGDLQCSVYSVEPKPGEAVFNIGTSSQITVVKPKQCSIVPDMPSIVEVPYFNGSNLLVAAALTGGNAFAAVADIFEEFLKHTDHSLPTEKIYSILIEAAETKLNTALECDPILLGERHEPNKRGSLTNISSESISLGDIVSSVLKGIAVNLESMIPKHILEKLKVTKLLGCGSALYNNHVLRAHITTVFGMELDMERKADAPLGAGMAIGTLIAGSSGTTVE